MKSDANPKGGFRMRNLIYLAVLTLTFVATFANARDVNVKYRGDVNVDPFECTKVDRSSFVNEVCYHAPTGYFVIQLRSTFYHYCAVNAKTYDELMSAPSMGKFYNANIKGNYDCRIFGVPEIN